MPGVPGNGDLRVSQRPGDMPAVQGLWLRLREHRLILPAPMLLSEDKRHQLGAAGWIYEIKWDGYRLVAGIHDGKVQLATRGGADATKWFPEIVAGLANIPGGPHILDGEVCVLDDLG